MQDILIIIIIIIMNVVNIIVNRGRDFTADGDST